MDTQQRSQPQQPDDDAAAVREDDARNPLALWWPEIAVAVLALVLLIPTLANSPLLNPLFDLSVALLVSVSAVLFRRAPGVALALVWGALALVTISLVFGPATATNYSFALLAITAFGTGRYGRPTAVTLSGASIVLVVAVTLFFSFFLFPERSFQAEPALPPPVGSLFPPIAMSLLLGLPWLVGLLLRSQARTAASEQVAVVARTGEQQAQEIAHLRADQARMAREVHDVVGHSLAVVLAQAESAQFLPAEGTEEHKRVLADIAKTARQSLQDVRAVLGATRDGPSVTPATTGGMDALIEGVRSAGSEVRSSVVGIPRPLPPERDAVAYRVLQEMLTNALRHGQRDLPIAVERHWDSQLRIEVVNSCTALRDEHTDGTGVGGMQRRLESVGGHLDVRRRSASDASAEVDTNSETYTATAWLPLES